MANWLLDYIEMTEYIPSELREQLTSIRELDLQVHNAWDGIEKDIETFFSRINSLSQQERQDQYDAFLKKCYAATRAAGDKVTVADKLHELVKKSVRLLDQGLEKLKEDLLEGDKAYIVEDLERRSQELDEQLKLEHESMLQQKSFDFNKSLYNGIHRNNNHHNNIDYESNHINHNHHPQQQINHHRHSLPAQSNLNHRGRNNSTDTFNSINRQRKRERKRLNSTMTIFNRNSRVIEDDSSNSNQTFLSTPSTPDYVAGLQNSLNDAAGGNNFSLTRMKGIMANNRSSTGKNDKSNVIDPSLGARQPILTTNNKQNHSTNHQMNYAHQQHPAYQDQLSSHLLSKVAGFYSGDSTLSNNSSAKINNHDATNNQRLDTSPFSALPLSSRHDPIMMAASQAISATQSMTPGRRTPSLKASYAALNSGRLHTAPIEQQLYEHGDLVHEVYCKCRSHIQGSSMIACDNTNCKIEWFHYECVRITTPPEGEWYCDDCRVSRASQKSNNNKQAKLETGVNVT